MDVWKRYEIKNGDFRLTIMIENYHTMYIFRLGTSSRGRKWMFGKVIKSKNTTSGSLKCSKNIIMCIFFDWGGLQVEIGNECLERL